MIALVALASGATPPAPAALPAPSPTGPDVTVAGPDDKTGAPIVPIEIPLRPDRSAPPAVQDPPTIALPDPVVTELHPGVNAWYVRVPGVRKVVVEVNTGVGAVGVFGRPSEKTRGAALASEAAGELDSAAFAEQLELAEVDLGASVGLHESSVWIEVPAERLPEGLEFLRSTLVEPQFAKTDVKRWALDQKLWYTVNGPSSQATLSRTGMAFAWYPADHPYGARPDLAAYKAIGSDTLHAVWDQVWHAGPITVVVVGDVPWESVASAVGAMTEGLGKAGDRSDDLPGPTLGADRIVAVEMPGQAQVALRARWMAPSDVDPDHAAMKVANFVMGGAFLSRLNSNLREEKGFTYGARSEYSSSAADGTFTVSVDVKAVNLAETITEIEGEVHEIATAPISAEELTSARRGYAASWNGQLQTASTAVGAYLEALSEDKTLAELRADHDRIQGVDVAAVSAAAGKWLADDRPALWVLVGDRAAVDAQLKTIGRQASWVSATDAMLGNF